MANNLEIVLPKVLRIILLGHKILDEGKVQESITIIHGREWKYMLEVSVENVANVYVEKQKI